MNFADVGSPVEGEQLKELRRSLLKCIFDDRMNSEEEAARIDLTKFPGMMPAGLCRRDFNFIRRSSYWVSEKSDGDRAMLLANDQGTYVVDKSFIFFHVDPNLLYLPQRENPSHPHTMTLLDGEMVYNHHYQQHCFNIFDVIVVNGKRIGEDILSKRLAAIREQVVRPIRLKYNTKELEEQLPFVILGKEFWPLNKITRIFDNIQHYEDEQGHRYIYQSAKRFNENDGVIFTPEERPYRPGRNYQLKKWKWPVLNTVQFLIRKRSAPRRQDGKQARDLIIAFVESQGELIEYRQLFLRVVDHDRLVSDLQGGTQCVAEFYYDGVQSGEWRYHRLKLDKDTPNNFTTVLSILEATADRLTKEEVLKEVLDQSGRGHPRRFESQTPRKATTPSIVTPSAATPNVATPSTPQAFSPQGDTSQSHTNTHPHAGLSPVLDEIYSTPSPHPSRQHGATTGAVKRNFNQVGGNGPGQDGSKRFRSDSSD